jgi:sigma-E factor negative regulatory protein RseC
MVEEKARVVVKSKTHAWVEAERLTGCNACAINKECGTGAIANYLIKKTIIVKVLNPIGAEIDDMVIVGVPERIFLLGSFMLYTMPLLMMFLSAGLGETLVQYLGGGESLVVLLGLGGLSAGLLGSRYISIERSLEPRILRTAAKAQRKIKPILPYKI